MGPGGPKRWETTRWKYRPGGGAGVRTIVLRQAGHHHLGVALGPQRAALQQRLAEVDAARVDVQPAAGRGP